MTITTQEFDAILRSDIASYIAKVFNTVEPVAFVNNWHIDLIAEYLQAIVDGSLKRLIINVPPGYTKSVAVNVAFTSYCMGINPCERILSASHSHSLSLDMSNKVRQVLDTPWFKRVFPQCMLKKDVENRQNFYKTTMNGYRKAVSVGGKIIGGGGDKLIIDDPLDANGLNDAGLAKCNNWFDQSFSTRLRDKKNGGIVLIMQRLHENDLAGHLLNSKIDKYESCIIPAIEDKTGGRIYAFGNFQYERKEGELLCSAVEGEEEINKTKERLGSYGFSGQYQQRPAPADGGVFRKEWFKTYYGGREYKHIILSWDTGYKANDYNDPSVCMVFGKHKDGFDILDVIRKRLEYPELKNLARNLADKWIPKNYGCNFSILIEDKASGQSLIQDLRRETKLPIVSIEPDGDKETRARTSSPIVESGKVFLPQSASWLDEFMSEILTFPKSVHKDQVDSLSQFLNWQLRNTASPLINAHVAAGNKQNNFIQGKQW